MSSQQVPTRFSEALDRLGGDVSLLREMALITSEDLPEVIANAQSAIESEDCERAASSLHKLKGMLSTFECDGVVLEIQEMLDAARKQESAEMRRTFQTHRDSVEELVAEIKKLQQ